jgi:hypothetical protein
MSAKVRHRRRRRLRHTSSSSFSLLREPSLHDVQGWPSHESPQRHPNHH